MRALLIIVKLVLVLVVLLLARIASAQLHVLVAVRHDAIFTRAVNTSLSIVQSALFGTPLVPQAVARTLPGAAMCTFSHAPISISAPLRGLRAQSRGEDAGLLVYFEGTQTLTTSVVAFSASCTLPGPLPIFFTKTGTVQYTISTIKDGRPSDIVYFVPFGVNQPKAAHKFSFMTNASYLYDRESAASPGTGFAADFFLRNHFVTFLNDHLPVELHQGLTTRLMDLASDNGGGWLTALSALTQQFVGPTPGSSFQCLNDAGAGYTYFSLGPCPQAQLPSFVIDPTLLNKSLDVVLFISNASSKRTVKQPSRKNVPALLMRAPFSQAHAFFVLGSSAGNCSAITCGPAHGWPPLIVNFTACTQCVESAAATVQLGSNVSVYTPE